MIGRVLTGKREGYTLGKDVIISSLQKVIKLSQPPAVKWRCEASYVEFMTQALHTVDLRPPIAGGRLECSLMRTAVHNLQLNIPYLTVCMSFDEKARH